MDCRKRSKSDSRPGMPGLQLKCSQREHIALVLHGQVLSSL